MITPMSRKFFKNLLRHGIGYNVMGMTVSPPLFPPSPWLIFAWEFHNIIPSYHLSFLSFFFCLFFPFNTDVALLCIRYDGSC